MSRQKNINMHLNEDSKKAILQRQDGYNSLSWIENFGQHLLKEDCKPHVSFQNGESDLILVLRIRNKQERLAGGHTGRNTMSAYLCFFKTIDDFTRFCVNGACDEDVDGLKDLMVDKAKWKEKSTINWWKEVFYDLKQIDEDTLRRKEVLASDYLNMNMMDFIEKIQKEIEKAIFKLDVDHKKINKVCIVEQYAMALPFQYAISRMFPHAKGKIYPFVWKEQRIPWLQNVSRFHVPEKMLHTTMSTSPQISIGDILKLGEKGVVFTLPLSKEVNGDYCVPSVSIFDNSDLKWNDLLKGRVEADYSVGNLSFKQIRLALFADGFQCIYMKYGEETAYLSYNGDKNLFTKELIKEDSSIASNESVSVGIINESNKEAVIQESTDNNNDDISDSPEHLTSTKHISEISSPKQECETTLPEQEQIPKPNILTPKNISKVQSPTLEELEEKEARILVYIQQGLTKTTQSLENMARDFFRRYYQGEMPPNASEEDFVRFWHSKYEECLGLKWQERMLHIWRKYKTVEFSNFYSFLLRYQHKLEKQLGKSKYMTIASAVDSLKNIRNLKAHAKTEQIFCIGRTKILFAMEHMITIAEQIRDNTLKERLDKYSEKIEDEWNSDFSAYITTKIQNKTL